MTSPLVQLREAIRAADWLAATAASLQLALPEREPKQPVLLIAVEANTRRPRLDVIDANGATLRELCVVPTTETCEHGIPAAAIGIRGGDFADMIAELGQHFPGAAGLLYRPATWIEGMALTR